MSIAECHQESFYQYMFSFFSFKFYCLVLSQVHALPNFRFLFTQEASDIGSTSWSGPQVESIICCLLLKLCTTITLAYFVSSTPLQTDGLQLAWCLCFSSNSVQSILLYQKLELSGNGIMQTLAKISIYNGLCRCCLQTYCMN